MMDTAAMTRLVLLGVLSAHAAANGATADAAWDLATDVALTAPAVITEAWLRQACAEASERARDAAWGSAVTDGA